MLHAVANAASTLKAARIIVEVRTDLPSAKMRLAMKASAPVLFPVDDWKNEEVPDPLK